MSDIHKTIKPDEEIFSVRGTWLGKLSALPTRSFILRGNDAAGILIIDTCGPGSGGIITDSIKSQGMNPAHIKGIALTHWHGDHTGGLAGLVSLVSESGRGPLKVYMHERDAEIFLKQKGEFIKMHPALGFPIYHRPGKYPSGGNFEFVMLSDTMKENPLKEWDIDIIPTPGHTPGHTSFLYRKNMTLFSGCGLSLFGYNTVGIMPVFYDRRKQIESAHKLMEMEFRYLYPAHLNIRKDEIPLEKRIPFEDKLSFVDRITGTLPLFRYPRSGL